MIVRRGDSIKIVCVCIVLREQFEWKTNIRGCAFCTTRSSHCATAASHTFRLTTQFIHTTFSAFLFPFFRFFFLRAGFVNENVLCYSAEYIRRCRRVLDRCLPLWRSIACSAFICRTARCSCGTSRCHQHRLWSSTTIRLRIQYPWFNHRRSEKPTRDAWRWCCQRYRSRTHRLSSVWFTYLSASCFVSFYFLN